MKITKIIALASLLLSCQEENINPKTGCRTAVDKTTNQREFLRCESYEDFNPTNIRSSQWDTTDSTHYNYRWEACEECK